MTDTELNEEAEESGTEQPQIPISEFFENVPPNQQVRISNITAWRPIQGHYTNTINTPEIQLHCSNEACNGTRFFRCITNPISLGDESQRYAFLTYKCSNCQKTTKTFSIAAIIDKTDKESNSGYSFKFGEYPTYGPPTPSRLIKLIGPDRDLFLQGRRCENQGLGIGAFVYYRRVVENQKNRIFDEIIKVAKKLKATTDDISELESAKKETQFSKSFSMVKKGIPQALLINGHNPLLLLHSALSEGVHDRSDEECLELASSVRVVLAELSDRLGQALKDEAELNHALSKLLGEKGKDG
ncbi:MAG: hypothetical protein ACC630_06815 [Nitrospinota bacterium]